MFFAAQLEVSFVDIGDGMGLNSLRLPHGFQPYNGAGKCIRQMPE